jgi:2-polyprenyl-6-hydroxyphenyl methylase/3-demethylubiquinone-9 3-methyltransferase
MLRLTLNPSWPALWQQCHLYDELEIWGDRRSLGYSYAYANRRISVIETVAKLVPAGGEVLDVAAASGNFTLPLAERGYRMVWNDLRPELAEWVRQKYERGIVDYVPGNIFGLCDRFRERFDGVIAGEIIEHVAHPDDFLRALAAVTKSGGLIFLTTPNGKYFRHHYPKFSEFDDPSVFESVQFKPDSDGHIFLLHPDEFTPLARKAGLVMENFALMTNPLTAGHVKLGLILPFTPERVVWTIERATRHLPHFLGARLNSTSFATLRKL